MKKTADSGCQSIQLGVTVWTDTRRVKKERGRKRDREHSIDVSKASLGVARIRYHFPQRKIAIN